MADAVIDSNSNGPSDTSPSDPSHDANDKQPTKEEKVEANIRNKISTVNDVSAKTSASTADVASSLSLTTTTTTTTTTANDCSQVLEGVIDVMENSSKSPTMNEATSVASSTASSREGRCEKNSFLFFVCSLLRAYYIFYDGDFEI